VPNNTALDILHPVELSYLETTFGKRDRESLLLRHASLPVLYTKHLNKGGNVSSLEGEKIRYNLNDTDIFVDNANITQADIVARNGIHILNS
jgi:uncharacterized surface protein with fasciclin (FAS1) repeats